MLTTTTNFDRTWDSKKAQQALQQIQQTPPPNIPLLATNQPTVPSYSSFVPSAPKYTGSGSTLPGMGSFYGSGDFSGRTYGTANFPNPSYLAGTMGGTVGGFGPLGTYSGVGGPASSSSYSSYSSLRAPMVGNWASSALSGTGPTLLYQAPVPVPVAPAKEDSLDNNETREARMSPGEKESLSPVQQLDTPERRDSKGLNTSSNLNVPLPPNSTIAEVTESEFSNSSANSLVYEVEEYEQGSRYEGHKLRGMRHGFGRFHYQDGGYYEGEWRNNKMHGFGKLFYQNGDLAYEGYWKDDMFHGKGKVFNDSPRALQRPFDYANLTGLDECWIYYDGEFEEDSKHGPGKVQLSNGESFEGEFQKDVIQGEGRFKTTDGAVVHGIWRDNRLVEQLE